MAEHKFQRWYEQNEYLKAFMVLLEDLEPEIQCEIAVDMIMEASNLIDRDYEKIIEEVGEYDPRDFKRWYDKNPNVHLAIESLKDLSEEQRNAIIKEFTDKIILLHNAKLQEVEEKTKL